MYLTTFHTRLRFKTFRGEDVKKICPILSAADIKKKKSEHGVPIQPDQINMTVLFLYLVKSNASVRYCIVAYTVVAFY